MNCLQVRFEKVTPVTSILRCTRSDGRSLAMVTPHQPGLPHDLLHWLVETELGFGDAMFGQLLRNENLREEPATGSFAGFDADTEDSVNAETIASTLDWVDWSQSPDWLELRRQCAESFAYYHLPMPELPEARWRALQAALEQMLARWPGLPVGGVLAFRYPPLAEGSGKP
ncbi:MAG: hypothetical protein EPN60_18235 [Nevskiaceae bacterium]|nr:MAG: hypothetical protein EPO48_01930 [Nevskiaceae bacterium]TAM21548.1 MAG: hypothetical protein EPN60_18235 [Nevskiaceae bacterium]